MMKTYSHKEFDPEDPKASMISIIDIANGLSFIPRFVGQLPIHYSVAEHCVMVAHLIQHHLKVPELAIHGLLHDAHEAYMGDIPSPVKELLKPGVTEVENKIDQAIWSKFNLRQPSFSEKKIIKTADTIALLIEDRDIRGSLFVHTEVLPIGYRAAPIGHERAKILFLETFFQLTEK